MKKWIEALIQKTASRKAQITVCTLVDAEPGVSGSWGWPMIRVEGKLYAGRMMTAEEASEYVLVAIRKDTL